jgi:hypothetical protein
LNVATIARVIRVSDIGVVYVIGVLKAVSAAMIATIVRVIRTSDIEVANVTGGLKAVRVVMIARVIMFLGVVKAVRFASVC